MPQLAGAKGPQTERKAPTVRDALPASWDQMSPLERMIWRGRLDEEASGKAMAAVDPGIAPCEARERGGEPVAAKQAPPSTPAKVAPSHNDPTWRRGLAVARNLTIPSAVHLAASTLLDAAREGGDAEVARVLEAGNVKMIDVIRALEANGNWFAACNLKARFPGLVE